MLELGLLLFVLSKAKEVKDQLDPRDFRSGGLGRRRLREAEKGVFRKRGRVFEGVCHYKKPVFFVMFKMT